MRRATRHLLAGLSLLRLAAGSALAQQAGPAEAPPWTFAAAVQADSSGIHLDQLVSAGGVPLPHLRLAPAPAFGQTAAITRAQVGDWLRAQAPDLLTTNWTGPAAVRVTRRARLLNETELREQLTSTLQREVAKDRGELELRLGRSWTPVAVPDEPLTLRVMDLPAAGLLPNLIVRFELLCGDERVGSWQLAAQARLWSEIPVARTALKRGLPLRADDLGADRRDLLTLREPVLDRTTLHDLSELTENLQPGQVVLARSVRSRPAIPRGRLVEALVQDGGLCISLKVEALEDGALGQLVRVRNPKSRRELVGQVQNDHTILVQL